MTLRNVGFLALALASTLTFVACQSAPNPEKKDAAADLAAVNALRGKFTAAFNSNDAGALAALYADDAIVMLPNQPAVEGRTAIQALYDGMFKANAAKIAINPLETQVAGDWAYDRGTATTTITPKSGKGVEESDKYIVVLKRLPGGLWKVYRDISNSNSALPAPTASKSAGKTAAKKAPRKAGKRR
jgi:uncharacterized protein (TIGR02246 family)